MTINKPSAIFILADTNTPRKRPNSKATSAFKKLYWEDATQEQREKGLWVQSLKGTFTYLFETEEEKQERWLDKQYHMRKMLNYILENYNMDVYNEVVKVYKDEFDKYEVDTDFKFPHCRYAGGQCDLFCPYYRGDCHYEEILDAVVTAM